MKPYTDNNETQDYFIREFSSEALDEDYAWHRDENNRVVTVLSGDGWELQLDNSLPVKLVPGLDYCIDSEVWHRIIPGNGNLKLKIIEDLSYETGQ